MVTCKNPICKHPGWAHNLLTGKCEGIKAANGIIRERRDKNRLGFYLQYDPNSCLCRSLEQ